MRLLAIPAAAVLAVLLAGCTMSFGGAGAPEAPALERPVVDQTETLSETQIDELSAIINGGRKANGQQTALLAVDTVGDQTIEQYSLDIARDWGVGDEKLDNGVLIVVAVDDRDLRIEVGRGLEGDIPDAVARRIGDDLMVPFMKNDDLFGALKAGATAVQTSNGAPDFSAVAASDDSLSSWNLIIIGGVAIIILGVFISMTFAGRRHRRRYYEEHGSYIGYVPLVTSSGSGSGSSSSSSSFGGGGFSGGGSSSSW